MSKLHAIAPLALAAIASLLLLADLGGPRLWEDESGEFSYAEPEGGRALLELAPTPSWRALQFPGR